MNIANLIKTINLETLQFSLLIVAAKPEFVTWSEKFKIVRNKPDIAYIADHESVWIIPKIDLFSMQGGGHFDPFVDYFKPMMLAHEIRCHGATTQDFGRPITKEMFDTFLDLSLRDSALPLSHLTTKDDATSDIARLVRTVNLATCDFSLLIITAGQDIVAWVEEFKLRRLKPAYRNRKIYFLEEDCVWLIPNITQFAESGSFERFLDEIKPKLLGGEISRFGWNPSVFGHPMTKETCDKFLNIKVRSKASLITSLIEKSN